MAAVESTVSFLVEKLCDMLVEEVILLRGVEDQIEWVETEFLRIECFLKDADGTPDDNERVKNWRRELRDVAYCAEYAIDIFFLRLNYERRPVGCWGDIRRAVFILKELAACREVDSEVERIKLKLHSISESRMTYGIECIGRAVRERTRQLLSPQFGGEPDFVGFEEELPDFIKKLTSKEPSELYIFSVVGMGGLGKTTLAAKLYSDSRVVQEFDVPAWASVSQQFAVRDICITIRRQIAEEKAAYEEEKAPKKPQKMEQQQLREEIVGLLKDRRYLIVVDDMWTKDGWDEWEALFPVTSNGSRVVLTTRHKDATSHADAHSPPSEKAFDGPEDPRLPELDTVGKQIVKKCNGLPLAIVSMGGVLAGKDETEWKHALSSISWQLGEGEARIPGILYLSYSDLPYELEPCFLYLAIFPEVRKFRAKKLIRLWAAEGLLGQRGDEMVEEVGEGCLRALIQRSMIHVVKRSSTGGIKTCRVHDLLR